MTARSFSSKSLHYSRQDAGRNLDGIEPPHFQTAIFDPTLVFVSAVVPAASENGLSVIVLVSTAVLMFCAVTVTIPVLLVEIERTYLEVAEALSPHPQLSAFGNVAPVDPCTVSVMVVRQALAARTISETFARAV